MNHFTINFGIIAEDIRTKEILHFVGFAENPDSRDFAAIQEELKTDEEFGLTKEPFELRRATTKEVLEYRKIVGQDGPVSFEDFEK